ncbi:HET-domain-containing protein [Hypoxylon crocopeplum]|nr:HET-domain-containing protein [Hypoxylon crocopeplum]
MPRYKYTPLDPSSNDIRLVTILPGRFDDPIRIKITHHPLVSPVHDGKAKRLPLKEIRKTLPTGWWAYETLEGRVLFANDDEDYTSWSHPDPDFPRDAYDAADREVGKSELDYEALSYTWGSPEDGRTIIVQSKPASTRRFKAMFRKRHLLIRKHLAEAIRHLRHEGECRIMWIDAICINQEDKNERREQVKRMGEIFSLARRVVAWLGPRSFSSGLALSSLDYLGRQVEWMRNGLIFCSPDCDEPDWIDHQVALPYRADVWNAIGELASRDWFRRLWIVQEIHLGSARSILQCGRDEIPWPLLCRAIMCIYTKVEVLSNDLLWNLELVRDLGDNAGHLRFEELLYRHCVRPCQDSRDKIYGLMSLASAEITRHIDVSYTRAPAEVFKQVFLVHSRQEQRLPQLPFSGLRHSASRMPPGPTWVPNWSQQGRVTISLQDGFCASGISASRTRHVDPGRLEVAAFSFATICCVDSQMSAKDFSGFLEICRRGLDHLQKSQYPTGETYRDALLQTLTSSRNEDRWPDLLYPTLAELSEVVTTAEGSDEAAGRKLSGFYKKMIPDWINRCCLFTLQNGYIGIIYGTPQQGDEVFVILGCDLPMLLRPTSTGKYEVIGDCYVHGIMDAEALLGPLPSPWRVVGKQEEDRYFRVHYNDDDDDTRSPSTEDPRLDGIPIPSKWEPIEWERTRDDPHYCRKFRNNETREVINSDPRLFPEALIARGVPIRTITLV